MRAQSPCSVRKSVENKPSRNASPLVKKQNPYNKHKNDENVCANILKKRD